MVKFVIEIVIEIVMQTLDQIDFTIGSTSESYRLSLCMDMHRSTLVYIYIKLYWTYSRHASLTIETFSHIITDSSSISVAATVFVKQNNPRLVKAHPTYTEMPCVDPMWRFILLSHLFHDAHNTKEIFFIHEWLGKMNMQGWPWAKMATGSTYP